MPQPDCKPLPPDPEPLDPAKQPPVDRYCDLVLTGGVTDGVVYPWAIMELAREYRFKNIGGTSVGAMAAALTAAAEYGRRRGSLLGFNEVLLKLPRKLGKSVKDDGPTRIFSLFQPAQPTKRLFRLFVGFFASGGFSFEASAKAQAGEPPKVFGKTRAIFRHLGWLVRVYWEEALLGGLLGLLIALALLGWNAMWSASALLALPLMLLLGMVFIGFSLYRELVHAIVANDFGICTGNRGADAREPSLVEWLHEGIQAAAGKPLDQPLTFRDLWRAPGGPAAPPLPPGNRKADRSIDLRMITTNLTHGRPYEFPLDEDATRLFFKASELRRFFPSEVVDYLEKHSAAYQRGADHFAPPSTAEGELLELPRDRLPIVVAARLSLSFPILFSAVPLWAIDYEPEAGKRELRRCRFSDGGICSNFPIHMFDAAIPEWPTFGISLGPRSVFRKDPVSVTDHHFEGGEDSWFRFDDETSLESGGAVSSLSRLLGFLGSIFYSAKDWNDKIAMRMPGVRDRIVYVALDSYGGLDLTLSNRALLELAAEYGQPAGKALITKFVDRARNRSSRKWDEHRWVRFNTFLAGLRERVELLADAAELRRYGRPISQQIHAARKTAPLDGQDPAAVPLTREQARDLKRLLAALKDLEAKFTRSALPQPYKPRPRPSLHIRAPL
jgi:predicted acylesterase/phospholipase RssA